MAPNKWTLGIWKAKCHVPILHGYSGGRIGMKDKWHRKFPFVKVIEKGVLHLDQTNSVEEER